ncbi:mucin-2-like [Penaeus indicus]|uniref:mucin-2-like n=1 Tax=Penaeus indicus TaxID=29960 RepID=UPI00300D8DD7
MSLKICNLQGVTDALFREFLSQPGERQWCSEILRSITKGERVETNDFLKLSSDTPSRSSPRSSPVNSPRNHAHLSPLLLPPSPRSPVSPLPQSLNSGLLFSRNSGQPGPASAASGPTTPSSTTASSSSPNAVGFSSVTNFFSTSLANEARPSTPTSSLGRKHTWRRANVGQSVAQAEDICIWHMKR